MFASTTSPSIHRWCGQKRTSEAFVWDAVNLRIQSPSSPSTAAAALGGERIQLRASIYIYSPLLGQPPGFCVSATHRNGQGRGRRPLLSASPPRSCSRPPVSDHIICPPSPARCSLAAKPSLCARGSRSGAALWSSRPAGQSEWRTQDARRTEETQA